MNLFIVTCLKEYQDEVYKILGLSNIEVFSATDVVGFKDNQKPNLLEDWFASGDEKFDSLFIFSFTSRENAEKALDLIIKYNEDRKTGFPLRAFIMPVEKSKLLIVKHKIMKERIVRAVAGSFVLISIVLSYYINIHWIWLGIFVGINLLQSSFTKFCPLEKILDALGIKGNSC